MSRSIPVDMRLARWIGGMGALTIVATMSVGCFCDAWPQATAWVDADCDGHHDGDEEPLEGVCVWSPSSPGDPPRGADYCTWEYGQTNEEGRWGTYASCFWPYFIVAQTPDGFQPTTDTAIDSMHAEFGFAPEGTCPPRPIVTPQKLGVEVRNERIRFLVLGIGAPATVLLLALGYWRFRRNAIARDQESSGE